MSEPGRIRDDGREADRALLRAAPPAPGPGLQERLRRAIEERAAAPRSRWRRWGALGLFGLLGTGTAFALGTTPGRQLLRAWLGTETMTDHAPAGGAGRGPEWSPLPAPPPAPAPEAAVPPRPARATAPAESPPAPRPILQPGLRHPPGEWVVSGAPEAERRPPAAPSILRITRQGRTAELRATADAIEGHLRGAAVSLRVQGARLTGKIDDQIIDLFLRNDEGGGTIAGESLGYALAPTDQGAIVRGWVPGHSVRVEVSRAGLALYPGCERVLQRQSAGVYQGRCADGTSMKLELPPAFEAMPQFPRLVVLGVLLTERDPVFRGQKPRLFPGDL